MNKLAYELGMKLAQEDFVKQAGIFSGPLGSRLLEAGLGGLVGARIGYSADNIAKMYKDYKDDNEGGPREKITPSSEFDRNMRDARPTMSKTINTLLGGLAGAGLGLGGSKLIREFINK